MYAIFSEALVLEWFLLAKIANKCYSVLSAVLLFVRLFKYCCSTVFPSLLCTVCNWNIFTCNTVYLEMARLQLMNSLVTIVLLEFFSTWSVRELG